LVDFLAKVCNNTNTVKQKERNMHTVNNVLVALLTAHAGVRMAKDYEQEEAVNDTAFVLVELLRTLHDNNFDIADLAQQALEL
jgi:hypothetical protein